MTDTSQIADALVLVFTPGVSLAEWRDTGMLEREWSLYERLASWYGRMVFVTWGRDEDRGIGAALGSRVGGRLDVVCPREGESDDAFRAVLGDRVLASLGDSRSVVVKTNQMQAGADAMAIVRPLRGGGAACSLLARGGFLWSRFVAREEGAASRAAQDAAAREAELCSAADVIVGTTRSMTEDLGWKHGVPADRLCVIPNYVDCSGGAGGAESREPMRVVFAGRFAEQKRVDLLIRAVASVRESTSAALVLRLIGAGPRRSSLVALAGSLGVPMEILDRVPHARLMEEMRTCGVYAQVSAYEGHPKTVLEAMGCGAAVLVTDTPGLGSVVRGNVTGLCVEDDVAGVAAGLARLVREPGLGARLGAAARAWVVEHVSLDRVVELEAAAHRRSLELAGGARRALTNAVRFDPSLVGSGVPGAVAAWHSALAGYSKRLSLRDRAVFLAAIDAPLYEMQGRAAAEAEGGLHPKHRLMRYHDFFVDRVRPGERVIDLGCGVGALACAIARRAGAQVVGLDWTPQNLAKACEASLAAPQVRVTWTLGDITKDRAGGRFDVVVLSNVLEHLRDRSSLLSRYREWYEPSRFLIRVPAFDREWRAPWKRELGVEWRLDPTHETEYTEGQLRSELAEAGLGITELISRWGEYWCVARPA